MRLQEEVFQAYKEHISLNMKANRDGAFIMKEALNHSSLWWNGKIDKTLHIPKVFDKETTERFNKIVDTSCRIFAKVIQAYKNQADYRKLFPFSKELEELILLPSPYDGFLPISRLDIFYNEKTGAFKFCEVNTDGTSGMLADFELRKGLIYNPAHQAVMRKFELKSFELFNRWVKTFIDLYNSYHKKIEKPNIAIVDFLERATRREFDEFARTFQEAGFNCEICDIRSLKYKNGVLFSDNNNRIDAIYRRAVTVDIINHYGEITDFLKSVKDDAVFIAGAFATQIIHTKWLFYVLHHKFTHSFLTEEECEFIKEHIPITVEFSSDFISFDEVYSKKNSFILKPMDGYASKGIYASGKEYSEKEWKSLLKELYGKGYVCQEYCNQYFTENIDFAWGDGNWHSYTNMTGLFSYNCNFSGILMRMAEDGNIIVPHENERVVPAFVVIGYK